MSTAPAKQEWLVVLPDNKGALEQRMKVRPDHLSALKPTIESGFWTFGGALLDETPKEGEGLKINGSVMLAYGATREEVLQALEADVYSKEQVWDWSKVQIFPFKSAFRNAL
ncbi:MAG: hypothetical protein M1829_006914 [Trizodia sp. TS-e1964]|nr:MAG: hypothetical protein M1829_006914 [Trizodia sp. TS-e1964]